MKTIAYVGVDYHLNFLSIAVMVKCDKEIYKIIHLENDDKIVAKYLKRLSEKFLDVSSHIGYYLRTKLGTKRTCLWKL